MPDITIPIENNQAMGAYIALPSGDSTAPAIIMIQEIFGVNAEMRRKCDEMAAKGFVAIAPDLFWRLEPGIQLTDQTQAEWDQSFDLFNRFDVDAGIDDLAETLAFIRNHEATTGLVGTVGYCLGGKLAYLMAARTDIDCAVGYYGVGIEGLIDEARNIDQPLMLHIAKRDGFCPPEAQKAIQDGLGEHAHVTLHSYEGVDHAFARFGGDHYDEQAAALANQRSADFLAASLRARAAA